MKDDQRRNAEGSYMKDRQAAADIAALLGTTDEVSARAIRNKMAVINHVFNEVYGPVIETLLEEQDVITVKARIYRSLQEDYSPFMTVLYLRKELRETLSVVGLTAKLSLPRADD